MTSTMQEIGRVYSPINVRTVLQMCTSCLPILEVRLLTVLSSVVKD